MSHGNLGFTGRRARPPAEDAGERLAGCPLCLLVQRAADDLLARWLPARRLPETTELQIRRAQGPCAPHAWWLLAGATERNQRAEGLARAMVDVLDAALGALRSYDEDGDAGGLDPTVFKRTVRYAWTGRIAPRLARTGACPVCLLLKRIQETLGYRLLELLRCPELRASYSARAALCLPHFRWAVDTCPRQGSARSSRRDGAEAIGIPPARRAEPGLGTGRPGAHDGIRRMDGLRMTRLGRVEPDLCAEGPA